MDQHQGQSASAASAPTRAGPATGSSTASAQASGAGQAWQLNAYSTSHDPQPISSSMGELLIAMTFIQASTHASPICWLIWTHHTRKPATTVLELIDIRCNAGAAIMQKGPRKWLRFAANGIASHCLVPGSMMPTAAAESSSGMRAPEA